MVFWGLVVRHDPVIYPLNSPQLSVEFINFLVEKINIIKLTEEASALSSYENCMLKKEVLMVFSREPAKLDKRNSKNCSLIIN